MPKNNTQLFHTYFQNGTKTKYMGKSILLYQDQKEVFDTLSNEQAGLLIKAIFQYQENGEVIKLDPLLNIVMIPIRQTIDRNAEKYDNTCKRNSENADKRWQKKYAKDTSGISGISNVPEVPKDANNDSNNDKDSDNKNDKGKEESAPDEISIPVPVLPSGQKLDLPIGEKKLVPEMAAKFKAVFPESFSDRNIDHPACLSISKKICSHYKIPEVGTPGCNEAAIKLRWGDLLGFAVTSAWWSKKTIAFIDSKFGDLIQDFNSKDKIQPNGRNNKAATNGTQQLAGLDYSTKI